MRINYQNLYTLSCKPRCLVNNFISACFCVHDDGSRTPQPIPAPNQSLGDDCLHAFSLMKNKKCCQHQVHFNIKYLVVKSNP